jgi:hypothetical protein
MPVDDRRLKGDSILAYSLISSQSRRLDILSTSSLWLFADRWHKPCQSSYTEPLDRTRLLERFPKRLNR